MESKHCSFNLLIRENFIKVSLLCKISILRKPIGLINKETERDQKLQKQNKKTKTQNNSQCSSS